MLHISCPKIARLYLTSGKGDTSRFFTGAADNTARIWDCQTGTLDFFCLFVRGFLIEIMTFK